MINYQKCSDVYAGHASRTELAVQTCVMRGKATSVTCWPSGRDGIAVNEQRISAERPQDRPSGNPRRLTEVGQDPGLGASVDPETHPSQPHAPHNRRKGSKPDTSKGADYRKR